VRKGSKRVATGRPRSRGNERHSPTAFGNQTISPAAFAAAEEIHGFAPPPRGGFAFIVCNQRPGKERAGPSRGDDIPTLNRVGRLCQRPFFRRFLPGFSTFSIALDAAVQHEIPARAEGSPADVRNLESEISHPRGAGTRRLSRFRPNPIMNPGRLRPSQDTREHPGSPQTLPPSFLGGPISALTQRTA